MTPMDMAFRLKAFSRVHGSNQPSFSKPGGQNQQVWMWKEGTCENTCNVRICVGLQQKCCHQMCFSNVSAVGSSRHKLTIWSQSHTFCINPGELLLQLDWGHKWNLGSVTPAKQSNRVFTFLDGVQSGELMLLSFVKLKQIDNLWVL